MTRTRSFLVVLALGGTLGWGCGDDGDGGGTGGSGGSATTGGSGGRAGGSGGSATTGGSGGSTTTGGSGGRAGGSGGSITTGGAGGSTMTGGSGGRAGGSGGSMGGSGGSMGGSGGRAGGSGGGGAGGSAGGAGGARDGGATDASGDATMGMNAKMAEVTFAAIAPGTITGSATFKAVNNGVEVHIKLDNCPPGVHGIHIHQGTGCADTTAQGGHWDSARGEGIGTTAGEITCDANMKADLMHTRTNANPATRWTLGDGSATDVVGHAMVVHGLNSNDRHACGVITLK